MRLSTILTVAPFTAALFLGSSPLGAQPAARGGATEPSGVEAELARMKTDLAEIKRQLGQLMLLVGPRPGQAPAVPTARARTSVGDAPALGRADAPVTVVEFSDYQCPFCARFARATLPALKRDYIDTGKVRYVFRDFPLDALHPEARKAAEAAHCAGDQGRYWEMHDQLFQHQQAVGAGQIGEQARALGLDQAAFDRCLTSGTNAARVAKSVADGEAAGVKGTPGFVVARTGSDGVVEGTAIIGAQPVDVFRRVIDQLLATQ